MVELNWLRLTKAGSVFLAGAVEVSIMLRSFSAASVLGVLSLLACTEVPPTGPKPNNAAGQASNRMSQSRARKTLDDRLADLVAEIPGFAGYFRDASGGVNVALVDPAYEGRAQQVLIPYFAARGLEVRGLRVVRARYDFRELVAWRRAASVVLGRAGASSLGIDERENRLRIGLVDESARARVEAELARAGVPLQAVIVDVVGRPKFLASLDESIRPVFGAQHVWHTAGDGFAQYCTHGVNVRLASDPGGSTEYLITAAHCTNYSSEFDGSAGGSFFLQDGYTHAQEDLDPGPFTRSQVPESNCPPGPPMHWCRFSDVARGRYLNRADSRFGSIAHTEGYLSTTLYAPNPYFSITAVIPEGGMQGETVNKVGLGSGWTIGTIDQNCDDFSVYNEWEGWYYTVLCAHRVLGESAGGDSGSPVFQITGDNTVALVGILSGGTGQGQFWYSSWGFITDELGAMITH